MKSYEKPLVTVADGLSEGVYASSGASSDCWTVEAVSSQDWNGSHHIFEIRCKHSAEVEHISSASTVCLTFNSTLTDAYTESDFACSFSGSTVTVVRTLHANAYKSGDTMSYKVWVKAADEATTKALTCIAASITCTKSVNVQGGGADGN